MALARTCVAPSSQGASFFAKGREGPAGRRVLDKLLQACLIADGLELGLDRLDLYPKAGGQTVTTLSVNVSRVHSSFEFDSGD